MILLNFLIKLILKQFHFTILQQEDCDYFDFLEYFQKMRFFTTYLLQNISNFFNHKYYYIFKLNAVYSKNIDRQIIKNIQ